jgi:hypothetical protein
MTTPTPDEPWTVRIADAVKLTGLSRSEIYRRHNLPHDDPGRIVFLKCGKRTLVEIASLRAAVAALPRV